MAEGNHWQRLTAERKFRIFLETRKADAPVGEILRKHGLTLEDPRAIEEAMETSAIAGLKVRAGHRRSAGPPSVEECARICRELREKERALSELIVEYTLLKKTSGGACRATRPSPHCLGSVRGEPEGRGRGAGNWPGAKREWPRP